MSRITAKTVNHAQQVLTQATAQLLYAAAQYPGAAVASAMHVRQVLDAGREYGRALDRVSRVRVKR